MEGERGLRGGLGEVCFACGDSGAGECTLWFCDAVEMACRRFGGRFVRYIYCWLGILCYVGHARFKYYDK